MSLLGFISVEFALESALLDSAKCVESRLDSAFDFAKFAGLLESILLNLSDSA